MKNRNAKILILVLGSGFLVAALLTKGFGLIRSSPIGSVTTNGDDFLSIPLSAITYRAKWYEDGRGARLFLVKAGDGTVRTAFDDCDVCYRQGRGYRQEGDYMICNNCGNRYPISGLGTENKTPGGCWPGYLPNRIEDDNVVIKRSDLLR